MKKLATVMQWVPIQEHCIYFGYILNDFTLQRNVPQRKSHIAQWSIVLSLQFGIQNDSR